MKKNTFFCCLLFLLAAHYAYAQREFLYADSLAIATNGCAYSGPSPLFLRMQADKSTALKRIRINSFTLLEQHISDTDFLYSTPYTYLRIGNFFEDNKIHAILVYLSDALTVSNNDYRVNVHLFEITNATAKESFFMQNISSGFESVATTITDFDLDGENELLIYTTEPEWYVGDRPMNDYYHLYNYKNGSLVATPNFESLHNPDFVSPNIVSTFKTCGCDGDCWIATLYRQTETTFEPISVLETSCAMTTLAYRIDGVQKIPIAESYVADGRPTATAFWRIFLKKFPQYLK